MKKYILFAFVSITIWNCAENPKITFSNSTGGKIPIFYNFRGVEDTLYPSGHKKTFEVDVPGEYLYSATASTAYGINEIDKSCAGMLDLKEDCKVLVTFYLGPAESVDSARGLYYKLWAAITDQLTGSPILGTEKE